MDNQEKSRYVKKNQDLFELINKIKLWPARSGILHGIKTIENRGNSMIITTHCGEHFVVWDSKTSRSARWLRHHWFNHACPKCHVPEWKLEKYTQTVFTDDRR
ncbi:MAG: pyrrolysine--tRNA(Pyl) ligase small subunit [Eubacteriaceae bacterium]|jgi:pyrrolysyl-tRNA synthetase-like protein|nr:pyrrolysine--tRNA(Pyl) ligase small subunit [Eubacteriaceae bacterium]MDD4508249.1 pyrrolysine--tRNA(Pyl) ligase small subunit [Eubacteriaceae bacterium]